MSRFLCCFNWKVYAGLGGIALAVLVLAPGLFWGALPLLIVAACPISMFLMMRGMRGGQCATEPVAATVPTRFTLDQGAPLADLKERLAVVQARRDEIAADIARIEGTSLPAGRSELPALNNHLPTTR